MNPPILNLKGELSCRAKGPVAFGAHVPPTRSKSHLPRSARLPPAVTIAIAGVSPATPWSAACRLGLRFVHVQGAAVHLCSIQRRNCSGRFLVIGHLHEAEAASPACVPVRDQIDARDLSKWFEESVVRFP